MAFKFEKLLVWQKAIDLADTVHQLTDQSFPKNEQFILTSQIQRAADSVSLNIAEGSTGQTNAEFCRFLNIALCSNVEVVGCLCLGRKRKYIDTESFARIYAQYEEILVMINGLKNHLSKP